MRRVWSLCATVAVFRLGMSSLQARTWLPGFHCQTQSSRIVQVEISLQNVEKEKRSAISPTVSFWQLDTCDRNNDEYRWKWQDTMPNVARNVEFDLCWCLLPILRDISCHVASEDNDFTKILHLALCHLLQQHSHDSTEARTSAAFRARG